MTDITVMLQLASKCQRTDMLREAKILTISVKVFHIYVLMVWRLLLT